MNKEDDRLDTGITIIIVICILGAVGLYSLVRAIICLINA